jgi:hypothetical protein
MAVLHLSLLRRENGKPAFPQLTQGNGTAVPGGIHRKNKAVRHLGALAVVSRLGLRADPEPGLGGLAGNLLKAV